MKTFIVILSVWAMQTAFAGDLATELLKASDQGRGGVQDGVQWEAQIQTFENGEESKRDFLVKAKQQDAYVEATAPAKNKNEIFLFNDRQMWFFKPSLKKPVSISARQKLSGQAANGDIASTNYARDYSPTLEKTEVINGEKFHVLLLKAKAKNLTYDQIRYWISDKTRLAMRADFLTLQGKTFKIGQLEYKNKINIKGKPFPFVSQLIITDAKFNQNKSIIKYSNPKAVEHPDSLFNVNNLTR
jgi:outer membrane lipoprotein-sorting protein